MIFTRIIPTLLIDGPALVKTLQFQNWKYLGDVVNAIRIFNEKKVDEIILLDISATPNSHEPRLKVIQEVAQEAFMPFCYGGGVKTVKQIGEILNIGAEKVAINSALHENINLIKEASLQFGSQSIVVSIDCVALPNGEWRVVSHRGQKMHEITPVEFARKVQDMGAGEIMLSDINRDGTKTGYNTALIESVAKHVDIPVIACCGAKQPSDFKLAIDAGASAVAAGALFTLIGNLDAPLISYPQPSEIDTLFS
jgi:cyclase